MHVSRVEGNFPFLHCPSFSESGSKSVNIGRTRPALAKIGRKFQNCTDFDWAKFEQMWPGIDKSDEVLAEPDRPWTDIGRVWPGGKQICLIQPSFGKLGICQNYPRIVQIDATNLGAPGVGTIIPLERFLSNVAKRSLSLQQVVLEAWWRILIFSCNAVQSCATLVGLTIRLFSPARRTKQACWKTSPCI